MVRKKTEASGRYVKSVALRLYPYGTSEMIQEWPTTGIPG